MNSAALRSRTGLRIAEELILLLLDKDTGALTPVPNRSLRCALAGAVLMDLELEDRIDTDLERLFLVDSTPVGDDLLDPCLRLVAGTAETRDAAYWIDRLAESAHADQVRSSALDRLVERGIVQRETGGLHSVTRRVVRSRRYPQVDGEAEREVELRVMTVLFSEEIPAPRDIMLIALVNACGIFGRLLSPGEMAEVRDRLELICKMDLIARTVFAAIRKAGVPGVESVRGRRRALSSRAARARALAAIPLADRGGLPVVGNAFRLVGDPIPYLARQYREIGPVFRLRAFSHAFTVLAGPEANTFIQRHGRLHLRNVDFYAGMTRALGAHRFTLAMDGAEHFRLRKALGNGYSRGYFLDRIDDATDIVARETGGLPERTPVTALPTLRRIIAKQIGLLCTGVPADEYVPDLVAYLDRMIAVTTMRRPGFTMRTPRMRRLRARMEALCEHLVESHEAERPGGGKPDLIDDVLALHRADPQFLPETELVSACIGPFIAGLHTAASVATCMLYALLKHPETMARMLPEADGLFADGGPTARKLRAMDVTHRVVMETLRLYRVAPVLVRTVVNSFEFAGHVIPAGTMVMFATTVPHVLPEHFPEPERFDIDRYAPERAEHQVPGVYAPFGLGTHRCLGNGFTEVSLALTLATMLHRAEFTMHPPNYRLKMSYSIMAAPKPSFKIVIARRR